MKPIKALVLFMAIATGNLAFPGTFTRIKENTYNYTGEVDFTDLPKLKALVSELNDDYEFQYVTVYIDSLGGYLDAGLELGRYTRKNDYRIRLVIKQAYSSAALWAVGDSHYKYNDNNSLLGFHLAYYFDGHVWEGEYAELGWIMGNYYREMLGVNKANALMHKTAVLRDYFGINTFVEWTRKGPEKYYSYTWDDNGNLIKKEVNPDFSN